MLWTFIFVPLMITPEIKAKLDTNGFVIIPTTRRNIYDIYETAKKANEPILVTQDLLLHTAHVLFNYTLRVIEIETLLPKLRELTKGMINECNSQALSAKDEVVKAAAYENLVFFGVAGKVLGIELPANIPEEVKDKIEDEVKLIEAQKGPVSSVLFGYKEDYTQYIPRGHYTRNANFEQYFKAMMWYGRMGFYLQPHPTMYLNPIDPVEEGIRLTRMALLITQIIHSSPTLAKLWNDIYTTTTFFAGKSDDFTVKDYAGILKGVNIADDNSVLAFINRAKNLPAPRIVSVVVEDTTVDTIGLKGFRFMGQRFIPDSYIFQNLVYPKVKQYIGTGRPFTLEFTGAGPMRCFPRGLDVMFVLGSEVAGDILKEEGDREYEGYETQVNTLKYEFDKLPATQWNENLYWNWLYILKKLITHPYTGYPEFMQSRLWRLKQLNTALGSWAQLRHDTILYGKQSYTLLATAVPVPPEFTEGWVEPYPEIYKLMSQFVANISKTGEYPDEVKKNLNKFAEILNSLSVISVKELKNEPLTKEEYRLIWDIGTTLRNITQFSPSLMDKITSGTDDMMAVIADVHTDPNSGKVLEEAVGFPSEIYVKLSANKIVKGGVFSYYEFKAPISERYTDEKWQEELQTKPPEMQKWFAPLLLKEQ